VEGSFDDKIIGFEVFKHYMTVLQEKNYIRQLKSKSHHLNILSHKSENAEGDRAFV